MHGTSAKASRQCIEQFYEVSFAECREWLWMTTEARSILNQWYNAVFFIKGDLTETIMTRMFRQVSPLMSIAKSFTFLSAKESVQYLICPNLVWHVKSQHTCSLSTLEPVLYRVCPPLRMLEVSGYEHCEGRQLKSSASIALISITADLVRFFY